MYHIHKQQQLEHKKMSLVSLQNLNELMKSNYPRTSFILTVIGLLIILRKVFSALSGIRSLVHRRKNLKKRYGEGSWALITGSSDGIGKGLAFALAKEGLNIILSARTKSKMEKISQDIRQMYPNVEVKILPADYSLALEPTYISELCEQISDLDISMVINNVGVDVLEYYHKLPPKEITHLIKLNCFPCTMLCHYFIPIMLKRTKETRKKCALVNVSSVAGVIPIPLHNIYSASKAYVDRLTTTLQYEYPQLDIVALRPSEVSTPMTCNKEIDVFTITAEQCANGLLDNLGHEKQTYGHWRHKLQGWLYENVPESLFNYIFLHYVGPDFMKQRSEAQKKKN